MSRQRVIFHVDMDAFYAAIEQRDHPELRGRALIIGGRERRGVVCTASYEARPYGVHSAMPMSRAMTLCPHAIVRPPRMDYYAEISAQVMDGLARFSPLVEPLSLDEAFLDMTGTDSLFGPPAAVAEAIQAEIHARTALTCAVGIAKNKFLAKLASDLDKPGGVIQVPFDRERAFIAPLPIRKLWGVGPKTGARLAELGLATIGDLAAADPHRLEPHLGPAQTQHLQQLARGEDDRPVVPERDPKSVGSEVTLSEDLRGREALIPVLRARCEQLARHLRRKGIVARAVRVKLRRSRDFRLVSRQAALPEPCDDSATLFAVAAELLDRFDLDEPIRLVGAAAFDLDEPEAPAQMDLFGDDGRGRRSELEHAVDAIRSRFGEKIRFGD